MGTFLFLKGVLCGFAIAAPVGPVGILTAQRTIQTGMLAGTLSALGAASADTIYGVMAGFGLHFIADIFLENQFWLRLVGGIVMLLVGLRILRTPPREKPSPVTLNGLAGYFASTFVLTITNPITFLSFGALFVAADAVVVEGDLPAAWTLVAGVFAGSALWFMSLVAFSHRLRGRFGTDGLRTVNRISAWLVIVLGAVVLLSLTDVARRYFGY